MSVLYIALPVSLALTALALLGFRWALMGGQLDDLETPAHRLLHEELELTAPAPPDLAPDAPVTGSRSGPGGRHGSPGS